MEVQNPSILLPFSPAENVLESRDFFIYLRPETNGVEIESLIMRAAREEENCRDRFSLVYLANFPGGFISQKGLVEHHYRIRLLFALKGKSLFTKYMKKVFKAYYRKSFEKAEIIGPYDAMKQLDLSEEELFNLWVQPSDMLVINGQTIKRYKNIFILNYDIPALLNRNDRHTDIAVMVFRTAGNNGEIRNLIDAIESRLSQSGIINTKSSSGRVFHYSKGPFEELLDSTGFLYDTTIRNIPLSQTTFGRYLIGKGVQINEIEGCLRHPIMYFRKDDGRFVENDIYTYTRDLSYDEAWERLQSVYVQRYLI